ASSCMRRSGYPSAATAREKSPSPFWRRSLESGMRSLWSIRNLLLVALLVAASLAAPAFAQPATPAATAADATPITTGPAWSSLPISGGDVWSLAIHPQDPDMVFAG